MLQSPTFRPIVLPLVVAAAAVAALFLWWRTCGCCSCCCCRCLQPRGTAQCGACSTCPYVIEVSRGLDSWRCHAVSRGVTTVTTVTTVTQGPVLRKDKKFCSHLCGDPRKMTFLKFRESCQSDAVVFCIHCDK